MLPSASSTGILTPRFLSQLASYNVASNVCQAHLPPGPTTGEQAREPLTVWPRVEVDHRADASTGASSGHLLLLLLLLLLALLLLLLALSVLLAVANLEEVEAKLWRDARSSESRATSAFAVTLPPAAAYSIASPILARSTPPSPPSRCPPSTTSTSSAGAARSIRMLCSGGFGYSFPT